MASAEDRAAVRKFQRREHYRAMTNAKTWGQDDQPAGQRTCTYCGKAKPDTPAHFPAWHMTPPGMQEVPCHDCFPAAVAAFLLPVM
jgi:hypothetical protein